MAKKKKEKSNKKKRNIGTINYCSSEKLASKEERSYQINVTNDYL